MPCDHVGPHEIITMAEERLRESGRSPAPGMKFRWAENHDGFFAAAITEIERRDDTWIVTRLDRLREPLPQEACGLIEIA